MEVVETAHVKSHSSFPQTHGTPLLQVSSLSHSFGKREVLSDVSFALNRGEVFGFLGPNGSGKSTILNVLAGILSRQSGRIYFQGKELADDHFGLRRQVGMVFQSPSLDLKLSAKENLTLAAG